MELKVDLFTFTFLKVSRTEVTHFQNDTLHIMQNEKDTVLSWSLAGNLAVKGKTVRHNIKSKNN